MKRKNNLFTHVPVSSPRLNMFDLSHEVKMSAKFGYLYPIMVQEVMPGDSFRDQVTVFARFAPMLAPIMHRVNISVHSFMAPYRILTDHWEDFITGGQDGTEAPVLPYITPAGWVAAAGAPTDAVGVGSLWDYLGLPPLEGAAPGVYSTEQISVLPFRAMAKIWNDYYRDPNLDAELELNTELAGNVSAATWNAGIGDFQEVYKRGWGKDYFTSALPWAQRGAEVLMPLSGLADVSYRDVSDIIDATTDVAVNAGALNTNAFGQLLGGTPNATARVENIDEVEFTNSSVSINDFRTSLAIQRWMENNARGGGRYVEQIESHFSVRVPDYRLQRAEYLGGGKQPVQISEVLSTADSEDVPVGDMAGHGISVGKTNGFTYKCQEHGVIISILSILPETAYSQGIDRMWTRKNKFDFAFPELAHLGEQSILSKEVFFSFDNADNADNQEVFGYIPRYAEYKFRNDRIAGDFRTTLGFWHLGRKFETRPVLNSEFTSMIENDNSNEETYRRIFAVQDGTDYVWMQIFHRMTAMRPLPYFGVPRLLG